MKYICWLKILFFYTITTFNLSMAQWIQTNGPNGGIVKSLLLNDTNLFAGTENKGIYFSTNGGENWVFNGLAGKTINTFATLGINIYAGTNRGIYLSTNNGSNWQTLD